MRTTARPFRPQEQDRPRGPPTRAEADIEACSEARHKTSSETRRAEACSPQGSRSQTTTFQHRLCEAAFPTSFTAFHARCCKTLHAVDSTTETTEYRRSTDTYRSATHAKAEHFGIHIFTTSYQTVAECDTVYTTDCNFLHNYEVIQGPKCAGTGDAHPPS